MEGMSAEGVLEALDVRSEDLGGTEQDIQDFGAQGRWVVWRRYQHSEVVPSPHEAEGQINFKRLVGRGYGFGGGYFPAYVRASSKRSRAFLARTRRRTGFPCCMKCV